MTEFRHVPNAAPDYEAFVASSHQAAAAAGGDTVATPFTSSSERTRPRLEVEVRSWLLQSVQLVMKTWPPGSTQCPVSLRGQSERDFSVYVGTGEPSLVATQDVGGGGGGGGEREREREREREIEGESVSEHNICTLEYGRSN